MLTTAWLSKPCKNDSTESNGYIFIFLLLVWIRSSPYGKRVCSLYVFDLLCSSCRLLHSCKEKVFKVWVKSHDLCFFFFFHKISNILDIIYAQLGKIVTFCHISLQKNKRRLLRSVGRVSEFPLVEQKFSFEGSGGASVKRATGNSTHCLQH